jgi:L-ascorbate metabolism protein UlaG (beta-lactamase superfamily)
MPYFARPGNGCVATRRALIRNAELALAILTDRPQVAPMSRLRKVLVAVAAVAILLVAGGAVFMTFWPSFGGTVAGPRLDQARASPRHKGDAFENVIPQSPRSSGLLWQYLRQQVAGTEVRVPPQPIPVVRLAAERFRQPPAAGLTAIWFGHASVYLELEGIRLMVDPILSDWASPVAGVGPKRFHPPPSDLQSLPKIDAVLISHDHYDHLDMDTVKRLQATGSHFFVPLGIGAHLERWGVPKAQFTELDWWQSVQVRGVRLTSTPVRHYSGRAFRDGNATLWSSWAMVGATQRVYFSGDTGFGDHFQAIGERLGPFDLSILKIGAYGPGQSWRDIHMEPEEAIAAHLKLRARRMLPVHWGTFNLAFHAWDEPIRRAVAAARQQGVALVTPRIGEAVTEAPFVSTAWWEAIR